VLHGTSEAALRGYAAAVVAGGDWPPHLTATAPTATTPLSDLQSILSQYFGWAKGDGDAGDLLTSCPTVDDMPEYVRVTLKAIKDIVAMLADLIIQASECLAFCGPLTKEEVARAWLVAMEVHTVPRRFSPTRPLSGYE